MKKVLIALAAASASLAAMPDELRSTAAALAEGVELTLRELTNVMTRHGVKPITPATGDMFDPQLHQAMSLVENNDVEPNTVIAVMQKGYTLNGRLVRPAMVMVSKGPAGK